MTFLKFSLWLFYTEGEIHKLCLNTQVMEIAQKKRKVWIFSENFKKSVETLILNVWWEEETFFFIHAHLLTANENNYEKAASSPYIIKLNWFGMEQIW